MPAGRFIPAHNPPLPEPPFTPHKVLAWRGPSALTWSPRPPSAVPLNPLGPLTGRWGPGCCCAATCWLAGRMTLASRAGAGGSICNPLVFPASGRHLGQTCKCRRLSTLGAQAALFELWLCRASSSPSTRGLEFKEGPPSALLPPPLPPELPSAAPKGLSGRELHALL